MEPRIHLMVWPMRHNPDEQGSVLIRSVLVAAKYKHVELALSYHDYHTVLGYGPLPPPPNVQFLEHWQVVVSATIRAKGVFIRYRTFGDHMYEAPLTMNCSVAEARAMLEFAHLQVGKPYRTSLIYDMLWPKTPTVNEKSWFCSQLVCACLQKAGKLHGICATEVTTAHELVSLINAFEILVPTPNSLAISQRINI